MKVTWLGQAGLLFETGKTIILVDPYLSDSVAKVQPLNKRRVPVDRRFFDIRPDVIICTHDHLDHTDLETLNRYLSDKSEILCLAPFSAWNRMRALGGQKNRYVMFNAGTEWTERDVRFRAVCAEHSDPYAIGVQIEAEGKIYYVTGDTLYSENIFAKLPSERVYALFLPVNGYGNNMNATDAARFSARVHAQYTIPVHFGLFDSISAKEFVCAGRIIPEIYREIPFPDENKGDCIQ